MISYQYFELANGLKVYVHEDHSTPMAVLNLLYNVGSKDEESTNTGFAHLFEHLMFGGSVNISSFDKPLQQVGGENNAFTSPDITNYYITVPAQNLETAFWIESDRMLGLSFDPNVLEVQRKVVIEEFKQRYLNQPYGDVWLKLRPLIYQIHPYQWPTIGKEIAHIEQATMDDVKHFFKKFYIPNNAILVIGGNVTLAGVKTLTEKWFGSIPKGADYRRNLPQEPTQTEKRTLKTTAKVPLNAFYKAYKMVERKHPDYYKYDLLSDILGRGTSSWLYQSLVRDKKLFNSIGCYVLGSLEPGIFLIEGKLNENVSFEEAENAVNLILDSIQLGSLEKELLKVKNQSESSIILGELELLNRTMNIAFAANMGDVNLVNNEISMIEKVTESEIKNIARQLFKEEKSSVLYYQKSE